MAIATPTIVTPTTTIRVWRVVGRMTVAGSWGRGAMSVRVRGRRGRAIGRIGRTTRVRPIVGRWTTVREGERDRQEKEKERERKK